MPGTRVDVDVRIDAALADELQLWKALEQPSGDSGPLANKHQRLGLPQPACEEFKIVKMGANSIEVVIQD